jgi:hypothetical protein
LRFVLSLYRVQLSSDKLLDQAFLAAQSFRPLGQNEVAALLAKTADAAKNGEYELFKTSGKYDSTAKDPEFLI